MHRSLGSATLACLLTTWVIVPGLPAQNKLYAFYGDGANDYFGHSVAGAGDVNQDGYDDMIVGAYHGPLSGWAGSARVLSGVDGSILYTFLGDAAQDQFGWSVAGAGDVNKDGYDDVIVGANWDDDNGSRSGSARVLSGVDGSTLFTFLGEAAADEAKLRIEWKHSAALQREFSDVENYLAWREHQSQG